MKTTIIIAAVLSLQVSSLFAANGETKKLHNEDALILNAMVLAPTTPSEADFSESLPESTYSFKSLAPRTPASADFIDEAPEPKYTLNLAPTTPQFADFNESVSNQTTMSSLASSTPGEADFE